MRSVIPFDTHAYVKKLAAAGMPEAQAEVMAEAWSGFVIEHLATKDDIALVRADVTSLREQIREVEVRLSKDMGALEERMDSRMESRLKDLELRLTLRLGAMMAVGFAVMTAFIKLL